MAAEGGAVLLYLAQDGRGIGPKGQLGFDADERIYLPAAEMPRQLGLGAVRLMTSNPVKVAVLERSGIADAERVPLIMPTSGCNETYLATKAKRLGHLF